MSKTITLYKRGTLKGAVKNLPASKSISNRAVILDALSGGTSSIQNLSEANDTLLIKRLIKSESQELNVEDAGTTMRFLTAFCAITGKNTVIKGSDRMKQRPIGILVDALRKLGAIIEYMEKEGFPPIKVNRLSQQLTNELIIQSDVSSQYISALLMIAPLLPQGLHLKFEGKVTSRPYIEMTASLMKLFGVDCELSENGVRIPNKKYSPAQLTIESDWSAASYWFAFTALADHAEIELPNMTMNSLQGDRVIIDIMKILGVISEPKGNGLLLKKTNHKMEIAWDFTHCPDLAQTAIVVCAAKGIKGVFTGLESLRIKETDRVKALQHEIGKMGASLIEKDNAWILTPSEKREFKELSFSTYLDHRMAMALAPLATLTNVTIDNPTVTLKSYPGFWEDVKAFGFKSMTT